MTDEQIIEAMAQAVYEAEYADADPWKNLNQDEKLSYVVLARGALAAARPLIREQALREAASVANSVLTGPVCPYENDKIGDPTYDHTEDDVCPVCKKNGHESGQYCVSLHSGRIAAAILALIPEPPHA